MTIPQSEGLAEPSPFSLSPKYFLNLLFPNIPIAFFDGKSPCTTTVPNAGSNSNATGSFSVVLPITYQIEIQELHHSLKFLLPTLKIANSGLIVALLTLLATVIQSNLICKPPNDKTSNSYPLRLPISLFQNPDPTIKSSRVLILKSALDFFQRHSFNWQEWIPLPEFFSSSFILPSPTDFSLGQLLDFVRSKLIESRFILVPHLVLHSTLKAKWSEESLAKIEKKAKALGFVFEKEHSSNISHVLYPPVWHQWDEERGTWIRSVEYRNEKCLVHQLHSPDSTDIWLSSTRFGSLKNPLFYLPSDQANPKCIDVSWVLDSYQYHEWMNELDYFVKKDGTPFISPLQQKWNPYFLVPDCGLEPTCFAKSHLLNTNENPFQTSDLNSRAFSNSYISLTELPPSDISSFPIFLHLSTLNSSTPSATSGLAGIPESELGTHLGFNSILEEERPFFLYMRRRDIKFTEQKYLQLRNFCINFSKEDPHSVLRFEQLKCIDPTLSSSMYCQLISFWEHRKWIYQTHEIPNQQLMPFVFNSTLHPLPSDLFCKTCARILKRYPYYQSIYQPLVYICSNCFAAGRFEGSTSMYSRKDPMSQLESPWTVSEKVQLLNCIETHGIHRWDLIAKDMQKTMESCVLNFVTLSNHDEQNIVVAPFEASPNPVLGVVHLLLPFVPPLAAHFAQQALQQLPDMDLHQLYLKTAQFALKLAKLEFESMQSDSETLFELILKKINVKWEKLSQLDELIARLVSQRPVTSQSGTSKKCK